MQAAKTHNILTKSKADQTQTTLLDRQTGGNDEPQKTSQTNTHIMGREIHNTLHRHQQDTLKSDVKKHAINKTQ